MVIVVLVVVVMVFVMIILVVVAMFIVVTVAVVAVLMVRPAVATAGNAKHQRNSYQSRYDVLDYLCHRILLWQEPDYLFVPGKEWVACDASLLRCYHYYSTYELLFELFKLHAGKS